MECTLQGGCGLALLGALFPLGITFVLTSLWRQEFGWEQIGARGELALYAAAMLAPSMHQILHDPSSIPFTQRRTFGFVGFVLFGLATVLFVGAAASWSVGLRSLPLNQAVLQRFSIVEFAVAVGFLFSRDACGCRSRRT